MCVSDLDRFCASDVEEIAHLRFPGSQQPDAEHFLFPTSKLLANHEFWAYIIPEFRRVWGAGKSSANKDEADFRRILGTELGITRRAQFDQIEFAGWKRPGSRFDGPAPTGLFDIDVSLSFLEILCDHFGFQNPYSASPKDERSEFRLAGFKGWLCRRGLRVMHLLSADEDAVAVIRELCDDRSKQRLVSNLYQLWLERFSVDPDSLIVRVTRQCVLPRHPATRNRLSSIVHEYLLDENTPGQVVHGFVMRRHCRLVIQFLRDQDNAIVRWFKIGLTVDPMKRMQGHQQFGWQGMIVLFRCHSLFEAVQGETHLIATYADDSDDVVTDGGRPPLVRNPRGKGKCANKVHAAGAPGRGADMRAAKEGWLYVLRTAGDQQPPEEPEDGNSTRDQLQAAQQNTPPTGAGSAHHTDASRDSPTKKRKFDF